MPVEAINPHAGGNQSFKLWYENYLGLTRTPPATPEETQDRYATQLQLLRSACSARFKELQVSHKETSQRSRFNLPFLPKRQDMLLENTNSLLYSYAALFKEAEILLQLPAIPPDAFELIARHALVTRRSDIISHDQSFGASRFLNGLGHSLHRTGANLLTKVAQAGENLTGWDLTPDEMPEVLRTRERAAQPRDVKLLSADLLKQLGLRDLASLADRQTATLLNAGYDVAGIELGREVGIIPPKQRPLDFALMADRETKALALAGLGTAGVALAKNQNIIPDALPEKVTLFGEALRTKGAEIAGQIQGIMANESVTDKERAVANLLVSNHFSWPVANQAAPQIIDGSLSIEALIYQNSHQFLNIDANAVANNLASWMSSDLSVTHENANAAAKAILAQWSAVDANSRANVFGITQPPEIIVNILREYNITPQAISQVMFQLNNNPTQEGLTNFLDSVTISNPQGWIDKLTQLGISHIEASQLINPADGTLNTPYVQNLVYQSISTVLHPTRLQHLGDIPEAYAPLREAVTAISTLTHDTVQTHDFLGFGNIPILRDVFDIAAPIALKAAHLAPNVGGVIGAYTAVRSIWATGHRISYLQDHDEALLNEAMRTNSKTMGNMAKEQAAVASYAKEQHTAGERQTISSFIEEQGTAHQTKDQTTPDL